MVEPCFDSLTPREVEVLGLVARGMESKEIGPLLSISHYRVDELCASAAGKLGVSRRAQAARLLAEHKNAAPERLGGQPFGVVPAAAAQQSQPRVREERTTFEGAPRVEFETLHEPRGEGKHRELSAVQVVGWIVMIIAALAVIGIATLPLSDSVQSIANRIDPPH